MALAPSGFSPWHPRLGAFLALALGGLDCAHPPTRAGSVPPVEASASPLPADGSPDCRSFGEAAGQEVLGRICVGTVLPGESLIELARHHGLGFNAVQAANPELDAFVPTPGAPVTIPSAWIVPRAAAPGVVLVNLSEMRLYLLPASPEAPVTFPVGVGSAGWSTPLGTFTVTQKQTDPTWYPTPSIRRENPELPEVVPPGPDNPLGTHALRLSNGSILIHGTDRPFAVGRKASHGCIRLYPEDIPRLYERVPVGTRVAIVREPVKVGFLQGRVYVEVHGDDAVRLDHLAEGRRLLRGRGLLGLVSPGKLEAAVRERKGHPVDVSADLGEGARGAAPEDAAPRG